MTEYTTFDHVYCGARLRDGCGFDFGPIAGKYLYMIIRPEVGIPEKVYKCKTVCPVCGRKSNYIYDIAFNTEDYEIESKEALCINK